MNLIAKIFIHLYRLCISPLIGQTCRFHPSCSEYALDAFNKHSFFYALWLTIKRIARCNPWHNSGGHDPVP